jgi:hypothetical protein
MAVPLSLAVGCATHKTTTANAEYGPTPVLSATSGEPEQRIYSNDPSKLTATSSMDAPPAGADSSNWNVAEAIRQKLTSDPSLAPLGSSLITEVGKDGTVTLKGTVKTEGEKQRVHDTIASVAGVSGVNDELKVGTYHGTGNLDMNQPQPQ